MKKLSLKNLQLLPSEMLQKEQLKSVFGGYGGYSGNCFDDAISELEKMEGSIGNGVTFSDAEASYWLNINYASCVCSERYNHYSSIEIYDACVG